MEGKVKWLNNLCMNLHTVDWGVCYYSTEVPLRHRAVYPSVISTWLWKELTLSHTVHTDTTYHQCWLIALSLSLSHSLFFCSSPFLLFSLSFSLNPELISSFEKVMILVCWDYVCALHNVMARLFIACRILIPQLKEWDDTCREMCVWAAAPHERAAIKNDQRNYSTLPHNTALTPG